MPPPSKKPKSPPPRTRAGKTRNAYKGHDEMSNGDQSDPRRKKKPEVVLDSGPQAVGAQVESEEKTGGVLRFFKGLLKT